MPVVSRDSFARDGIAVAPQRLTRIIAARCAQEYRQTKPVSRYRATLQCEV